VLTRTENVFYLALGFGDKEQRGPTGFLGSTDIFTSEGSCFSTSKNNSLFSPYYQGLLRAF